MRIIKLFVAIVAIALCVDASAQQLVKKRVGIYKENGNVVVAEAATTLAIDIVVEHETFTPGIYARYAQKLLGTRASFVERDEYRIASADVAVIENPIHFVKEDEKPQYDAPSVECELPLPIDRISGGELSPEHAAKEAAEQIFSLRRARLELITGDFGDGVFGGGLESALKEIERLEKEYLDLFYGTRKVEMLSERFYVPVAEKQPTTIVTRFSTVNGIVATSDMSGDIVLVTITPSKMTYPLGDIKGTVEYRYANNADVVVALGNDILVRRVLPIYEFGRTVMFLQPR